MKKGVLIFLMAISVWSCKKEPDFIGHGCSDEAVSGRRASVLGEVRPDDSIGFGVNGASVLSIINNGGQQSSTMPTPGTWTIKASYVSEYQHFYQMDAKPEYPGSVLCGPVSYMLAAHMIATSKGVWYPSSKAKVGAIYNKLSQAGKFDDASGMYISDVQWFCSTYDYPTVKASYRRTTDRTAMKEYIEFYLKSGYPVIVTVNIFGMQGSYWGNDLAMSDVAGTKYYISKNGSVGHFIVLTGIKINADGSGTIWYKDPLSSTGDTRSASYTRILDAMKYNGNNDYYDAVGVFE
jgi:hypothetical protein